MFSDSSETEIDIDEGKTMPKKPNLAEIRESFFVKERQKRSQIIAV